MTIFTLRLLRLARAVKNGLTPDESRFRKIRFGLARGCYVLINPRYQFREFLGLYESEIGRFVRAYARPDSVCYDIGAGHGYYTVILARLVGPNGTVYSFEPEPKAFADLEATIRRNQHLAAPMLACRAFVGDGQDGTVALDALVGDGLKTPGLLKLDVEGAELAVLKGASAILAAHHPRLIVEVHSKQLERDCLDFVARLGYTTTIVDQGRLFPDFRPIEHNRWFCATNASAPAR